MTNETTLHNTIQYIIKDISPTGLRMTIGIKGRDKMKNTESLQIAAPVPIEEVKTVQRKTSDKTKTQNPKTNRTKSGRVVKKPTRLDL